MRKDDVTKLKEVIASLKTELKKSKDFFEVSAIAYTNLKFYVDEIEELVNKITEEKEDKTGESRKLFEEEKT